MSAAEWFVVIAGPVVAVLLVVAVRQHKWEQGDVRMRRAFAREQAVQEAAILAAREARRNPAPLPAERLTAEEWLARRGERQSSGGPLKALADLVVAGAVVGGVVAVLLIGVILANGGA